MYNVHVGINNYLIILSLSVAYCISAVVIGGCWEATVAYTLLY